MTPTTQTLTLTDAARITGRDITARINGFQSIDWNTDTHSMRIQMVTLYGATVQTLAVFGKPRNPWLLGGEVRRGRPREITVYRVTERYLKSLRAI